MSRPWFLYVLECRDGSLYTGISVDVAARFTAHARGRGARYTRAHPPQRIVAVVEFADRSQAAQAEYTVKGWSTAQKRTWIAELNQV